MLGENRRGKRRLTDPFRGMYAYAFEYREGEEIIFRIGQTFKDVNAVRDYAIKGGYELVRKKSDLQRFILTCASS